jgi:Cu-Zn family superoxide dismutase
LSVAFEFQIFPSLLLTSGLVAIACASAGKPPPPPSELEQFTTGQIAPSAVTVISPRPNSSVRGIVRFVPDSEGVRVSARFEGFEPNSVHGLNIHEFGDCSDPTFATAGEPLITAAPPDRTPAAADVRHEDIGNVSADAEGVVVYERVIATLPPPMQLVGYSVIVHQGVDDSKGRPVDPADARLACGTIGRMHRSAPSTASKN